MKLVHFEKITTKMLSPAKEEKCKEKKAAEITRSIVYSTKNMQPIAITAYLSSSELEPEDKSVSETQSFDGTAIKTGTNTWQVFVDNQPSMTVTDKDLLDTSKFFVQGNPMSAEDEAMKKQSAKQKRARRAEKIEKEKTIREKGLAKRHEFELQQFNNLQERFKSGAPYEFEEFLEIVNLVHRPFVPD